MKSHDSLFILPNKCKLAGIIIAAVAAIALIGLDMKPPIPKTLVSVFILGLLIFVLSREKHEDEMIIRARYVSAMHALVVGLFIAIIVPPFLLWIKSPVRLGYQELALTILSIFIVNFYWFIIQAKYEKHD